MSRTMKKNGQRVFDAICLLTQQGMGMGWERVSTAHVALQANCSKPTAAKYLHILREYGVVSKITLDSGMALWAWVGEK